MLVTNGVVHNKAELKKVLNAQNIQYMAKSCQSACVCVCIYVPLICVEDPGKHGHNLISLQVLRGQFFDTS